LRSVVALFDRPAGPWAAGWLRDYIAPLSLDVERRIVRVANRLTDATGPSTAAEWAALDGVCGSLGAAYEDRRNAVGAFEAAAHGFDAPTALSIVCDDGTGRARPTQWALRSARGSVLVLPAGHRRSPPHAPRRALLVARDESEIGILVAWSHLLQQNVEIELRAVFLPASDAPHAVIRDLQALRRTLLVACSVLAANGRVARADAVLSDDPIEDGCDLVVRVARRGWLRRWLPGADARGWRRNPRARLLIAPATSADPEGHR
jgi:hypothetical protein